MKIRVMVVDDEPMAREELIRMIEDDGDFTVTDQASGGDEALRKLKQKPDLDAVFLDIEMPGLNGLEVAGRLADWPDPPLVAFATAYHQHALEAFEANAVDYILKPYDPARVRKALDKIKTRASDRRASRGRLASLEQDLVQKGLVKKLAGHRRNAKERIVIQPEEVFYFHAKYAEVTARLADQELIINATLKDLLNGLDPGRFAQTHKAYVVNIDRIEKVSPMFSGNFEITLKSPLPEKIPLSRRYARTLKTLLGSW